MTSTIRARLIGLTATLAILAVLAGLPAMLLAIGANPIPDHVPTLEQIWTSLTSRDDGTLTLRILAVVAWAGWAFLTATITLEVLSRLRRIPTPHLPALALPQSAARGLVGAAVLLFAAGPALPTPSAAATPLVAATAPVRTTPTTPTQAPPTASHQGARATRHAAEDSNRGGARTHTVTTGESLWSIADRELGDATRWHEIADLNPGTHGPRWRILAGTTVTLPTAHSDKDSATDAARRGGATYTVRSGDTLSEIAEDRLGDADRYPQIFAASRDTRQADGRHLRDPDLILPGWHLTIPGTEDSNAKTAPAPAAPQLRAVPRQHRPRRRGHRNQTRRPRTREHHTDHRHHRDEHPSREHPHPQPSRPARHSRMGHRTGLRRAPARPTTPTRRRGCSPAWPVDRCWPGPCGCCCADVAPSRPATDAPGAPSPPHPRSWRPSRRPSPASGRPPKTPSSWSTRRCSAWPATTPRPTCRCPPWPPCRSAAATSPCTCAPPLTFPRRGATRATAPGGPCPSTPTRPTSASWSPTSPPPTPCWSPSGPATPATCGCTTART